MFSIAKNPLLHVVVHYLEIDSDLGLRKCIPQHYMVLVHNTYRY